MMQLARLSHDGLIDYVCRQLQNYFPDDYKIERSRIERHLPEALARLAKCINAVRMWTPEKFDHLHSSQYCLFLYYLSNTIWRADRDSELCTRLFLLNKALNGIDCFYEIEMPDIMFIGHSVGIVLAKATYGNYLVLYQNSTVGKNHGVAPELGEGTIMYPNTAIIGRCKLGDNTVLSQGASLVNTDAGGQCMVFRGGDGRAAFKPLTRDLRGDFFRE